WAGDRPWVEETARAWESGEWRILPHIIIDNVRIPIKDDAKPAPQDQLVSTEVWAPSEPKPWTKVVVIGLIELSRVFAGCHRRRGSADKPVDKTLRSKCIVA